MTIKLKSNGLYETETGLRVRVTVLYTDIAGPVFGCPASTNLTWDINGLAITSFSDDNIIREIEELRWVPISRFEEQLSDGIYRVYRGHLQQQVTRKLAQLMAPNYNPLAEKKQPSVREMTLAEVIQALGFAIKIVQ